MKIFKAIAFTIALAVAVTGMPAEAKTIRLGGIKITIPSGRKAPAKRSTGSTTNRNTQYANHPRWQTVVVDGIKLATNDQGIWIGFDDTGEMVMQLELEQPVDAQPGAVLPVQIEINGRYYETVTASVATENMAIVHGPEVERILGRLMSGRTVAAAAGRNRTETHLKGSSVAIKEVRAEAAIQRRLFLAGKVGRDDTNKDEPEDSGGTGNENVINYFAPGYDGLGIAEVRFDIVEGAGLVLNMLFAQIEGHGDPGYYISMNVSETERAIELIRKAEKWTEIARTNRVGLFSKRIGFIDDALADGQAAEKPAEVTMGDSGAAQETDDAKEPSEGSPSGDSDEPAMKSDKAEPADFRAVNFNSYENGTTSVQIEHAVAGFSRRFNLALEEALELAASLEATLEHASFKLEKRDFDTEEKDRLFQ